MNIKANDFVKKMKWEKMSNVSFFFQKIKNRKACVQQCALGNDGMNKWFSNPNQGADTGKKYIL